MWEAIIYKPGDNLGTQGGEQTQGQHTAVDVHFGNSKLKKKGYLSVYTSSSNDIWIRWIKLEGEDIIRSFKQNLKIKQQNSCLSLLKACILPCFFG